MSLKPVFYVAIVGGRDFFDRKRLYTLCGKVLRNKSKTHKVVLICGGAKGADTLGEDYAKFRGWDIEYFIPDWHNDGNGAGMRRNTLMANRADGVIAFWDGKSKGTKQMIAISKYRGRMVRVFKY